MAKVFLSFEAESDEELAQLVLGYAAQHRRAPSWLGQPSPPSDPELVADQATLADEDYDAKHSNAAPAAPKPEPEPEDIELAAKALDSLVQRGPVRIPAAKKARAPRAAPAPASEPEPVPAPVPAAPARELPALDTLKSVVTTAVRLAQKGEGSKKILELLPAFKDTTGLDFVMNAEDKHRAALYDLVSAADLPVV